MSFFVILGSILGGGAAGVVATAVQRAYVAQLKRAENAEQLAHAKETREDDITQKTALEDRADRRRTEGEVRKLQDTVTELSVAVARCEERHKLNEARERTLKFELDMTRQLADRQRLEIIALHEELTDLRTRFDEIVKRLMSVEQTAEVPHAE